MRLLITTQTVDRDDPILGFFHAWIFEFSKYFEQIDIICLREGKHTLPKHVHVHTLGKEKNENRIKYLLRFYYFFTKVFFGTRVDYVFFHMGAIYNILAAPFFFVRRIRGTQFLWWKTHGKMTHLKERCALACTDKVLTAGSRSFGLSSPKVRVVGHAIDIHNFSNTVHVSRDPHQCLMVGRIVPIKKIEVALRTMRALTPHLPDATLTIVGSPDSEAYQETLLRYCREEHLTAVHFVGARPYHEIGKLYARATILFHPAYEAGFDKVVLEAMVSGVIPLTSISSFEPILSPFGLYIPEEDIAGYTAKTKDIFAMDTYEQEALRVILRNIVLKDHSLETLPARIFGV